MSEARPRRNRILVGVPLYGPASPRWVQSWEEFKLALSRYERNAGIVEVAMSYVELAMNTIVRDTLADCARTERPSEALTALQPDLQKLRRGVAGRGPGFQAAIDEVERELTVRRLDYFLFIEADNLVPGEVIEKVAALDPRVHHVVGFAYIGRTEKNLMPVSGNWDDEGRWTRHSYEQFQPMMANPGMYEVGSVGMGCTAIHRSVFERWLPEIERGGWFQNHWQFHAEPGQDPGFNGHDIWFCHRAREQGFKVWLNTELEIGHLGEYNFTPKTFLQTHEFNLMQQQRRVAQDRAEAVVHVGYVGEPAIDFDIAELLEGEGIPVQGHKLGPGTERHELFARLWNEGRTFLSVEPDIAFRPGDLQELLDCPEPWCAFAGACPPFGYYTGLGCTKITGELIRQFPDAMHETGTWSDPKHPPKHWCTVDGRLVGYLASRGAAPHVHGPCDHRIKGGAPGHGCVDQELIDNPRPMVPPPYLRQIGVAA